MSRTGHYLLALGVDRWSVARIDADQIEFTEVPFSGDAAADEVAEQVASALDRCGYDGREVCLGLPTRMVLAAGLRCDDLPRRGRDEAMLYRLEEQLPLEAESLTAAFLPAEAGRTPGLAVRTEVVGRIIEKLSDVGILVGPICATSLLALWQAMRREDLAGRCDYVVMAGRDEDAMELYPLGPQGTIRGWTSGLEDADQLARCIEVDLLAAPHRAEQITIALTGDHSSEIAAALRDRLAAHVIETPQAPTIQSAALAAGEALGGRPAGWADFRTGRLARPDPWAPAAGALRLAAGLLLALLVAASAVLLWRSRQYANVAADLERQQVRLYQSLYPGRQVPLNVKSRLQSDLARLSGVSGLSGELPARSDALETLRSVAAGIPDLRLRITRLRIGPSGVLIEGQGRSHSDAEGLARSLAAAGLATGAPRTQQLVGGGVAFVLSGTSQAGAAP